MASRVRVDGRWLALLVGVGLATGCGETVGPTGGSFTAYIGGDVADTLTGRAVFDVIGASEGFGVGFSSTGPGSTDLDVILVARYTPTRPDVGWYEIRRGDCGGCSDDTFDAGYVLQRSGGVGAWFISESGVLTITESSSQGLVGSVTMQVSRFQSSGGFVADTLTISVTFEAVPGALPSL
jgi:hypothetical protein